MIDEKKLIEDYISKDDWRVKENSNSRYSFGKLMAYIAGTSVAKYSLENIYPERISKPHLEGYYHLHDLSHGIVGYCSGWNLKEIIERGFSSTDSSRRSTPPKHFSTVLGQLVNFFGCVQQEFAGAQAVNSFDTFLAPFVREDKLEYDEIKQEIQSFIFSMNVPSRWAESVFSNITLDWVINDEYKDKKVIVGGKELDYTYGDCQKEMDLITNALLEVMMEGDADGRIFSFPIITVNLTENFDWNCQNAEILWKSTAKYGLCYFQNYIGSELNPNSNRAMCCRLSIDINKLREKHGGIWTYGNSTGSIGVVTINLNRVGLESKTEEEFFIKIDELMGLAKESLEIKRILVEKNLKQGLMPYTKNYLTSFNDYFSTIGFIGLHDCCMNFLGKGIETEEGLAFSKKVLNYMLFNVNEFTEKTGHLYNLEASPAEGASYRLAKLDKKYYPSCYTSGDETPYLTNSCHLHVSYTDDLFSAIEHQAQLQTIPNGGTIFHAFVGEKIENTEALKSLIKKIADTELPYFSITPSFSICPEHKYIPGKHFTCPHCEKECEVYSRIVGYYSPIKDWNKGKSKEFELRKTYKI